MFDTAVIGAGPAGLSAAVNARARGLSAVVLGQKAESSMIYPAERVDNHLGMPAVSGARLIEAFTAHARESGAQTRTGRALQIMPMDDYFVINFDNDFIEAKTVIIARGVAKSVTIKNEDVMLGSGVSYCATCDGMLYKGKRAVVVGEIAESVEDANFLSGICEKVWFVPAPRAGSKEALPLERLDRRITVVNGKCREILGGAQVAGLALDSGTIDCEGVFIIKGNAPIASLLYGLETEGDIIKVNRLCETNIPGVYAAGDCTGWPYQVSKAVGEGLVAAQQAAKYLAGKNPAK